MLSVEHSGVKYKLRCQAHSTQKDKKAIPEMLNLLLVPKFLLTPRTRPPKNTKHAMCCSLSTVYLQRLATSRAHACACQECYYTVQGGLTGAVGSGQHVSSDGSKLMQHKPPGGANMMLNELTDGKIGVHCEMVKFVQSGKERMQESRRNASPTEREARW